MSDADDLPLDVEAALRRCAAGDQFALRAIYQSERRRLMAVALRLVRRRELAEEILHDAFLQIWNKADTYDSRLGSARGWIYTIVRHRALDALRSMQSSPEREDPDYQALLETYAPPDSEDAASEEHAIARCLERLEDQRRQSVLLAFVDGYSHEQVAARLGAPLGTVKSWIRRGLISLRECLS
ncbi:MAG: sigma-70 family RNA polymerase sigma factor [Casimicrobiaceae bacterium]